MLIFKLPDVESVCFSTCFDTSLPSQSPGGEPLYRILFCAFHSAAFVLYADMSLLCLGNWSTFGQH